MKIGKEIATQRLAHDFPSLPAAAVAVLFGVNLDMDMPMRLWIECRSLQAQVDQLAADMLAAEQEMQNVLQEGEN